MSVRPTRFPFNLPLGTGRGAARSHLPGAAVVLTLLLGTLAPQVALGEEAANEEQAVPERGSLVSGAAPPSEPSKAGGSARKSALPPERAPVPPAAAAADLPEVSHAEGVRSSTMILVGSILSGVGTVGFLAGGALVAEADSANCQAQGASSLGVAACESSSGMDRAYGTAFLVAGGLNSAVGIPLIVVGSQRAGAATEQPAALRVAVQATGASVSLSF